MTISSVSDLLAVGWTHAYCTEGPEFQAVAPAATGGVTVGPMQMTIPVTTLLVANWPDEVGTADLTQATDANKPFYTASSADMNNLPTIWTGDPSDKRFLVNDWSDIAQTYEVVMIGRVRSLSTGRPLWDGVGTTFSALSSIAVGGSSAGTGWRMSIDNGGGISQGGTRDSNKHMFRMVANGGSSGLWIDEAAIISGGSGAGTNAMTGLTIGSSASGSAGTAGYNDYWGIFVKSGSLTATQRSEIHSFVSGHVGTP